MGRQSRKLEHITYSLSLQDGPGVNGFSDVALIHNCLPDLDWKDIELSTSLAGIKLHHPVIINAITGGAKDVGKVNAELAQLALATQSAMAVGSQFAAIENNEVKDSYEVVRKINPDGVLFANLGAHVSVEQAKQAVAMIGAQGIQIHLNVAQEIVMSEGDRSFRGYLRNIARIVEAAEVPVIVKEVGCGMAREQAAALADVGVKAIDIGGMGGTNFLAIEAARKQAALDCGLLNWGIPTAISTIEVAESLPVNVDMMVSGGIRTSLDIIKALALGGTAIGIAAPFIKKVHEKGVAVTIDLLQKMLNDLKRYMLLLGTSQVAQLNTVPVIITGYSADWLTARGIDIKKYALRQR